MNTQAGEKYYYEKDIECMPRDQLAALQLEKLKRIVAHAYAKVPHYQKSFDAAGVKPDDLHSLDDFKKFPFTVKDDLRDNYPFGMFAVPKETSAKVLAGVADW